ncbi:MAG: hypothetical protein A2042_10040 [Candidatus Schekmanbacteria bacterium GWA2_38_11]|uniref:Glycosyltransferase RgtA/B/C/D-like domain-containing protein n=1 Tax=Candidatus Schekmanbacteria bacterium GWA2_38_11 TaxID=1817876 RepID=A0A1F7RDK3_9BACT|nr:MAG: hypothetical protein A2042_10040 [Candidatus Schekmanbacteria bacterium GWA2_38_11]
MTSFLSLFILDKIPHIQDEIAYLFQAKIFSIGNLYATPHKLKEFFDYEFVINNNGKWYGKYFFGFPLLLSLGVIIGYPWIINPLIGAISIFVISLIGRDLFGKETERFTPLLCLVSPFYLFMCATYLSHPSALLFSSIFILYFIKSLKSNSWKYPLFSGLALGFGFNIRPYDSLLIALPFLFYGIVSLIQKKIGIKHLFFFVLPTLFFLSLLLSYNFFLTGDAFLTPFNKYCPDDRLGFGKNIGLPYLKEYGQSFFARLVNTKNNLQHISQGLLGWPVLTSSLIFIPFFSKTRNRWDWIFLTSFLLIVFGYVLYYIDGIAFGARYYFQTLPILLILMVRGISFIDEPLKKLVHKISSISPSSANNVLPLLIFFLLLRSAVAYIPERAEEYKNRYWNIDSVLENMVKKANIHNAVVFIKSGNFKKQEAAPNYYGAGFFLNSPKLDTDIIYARDLGDEKNEELMKEFPRRKFYRFIYYNSLITDERAYTLNLKPVLYEFPKPELGQRNFFYHIP